MGQADKPGHLPSFTMRFSVPALYIQSVAQTTRLRLQRCDWADCLGLSLHGEISKDKRPPAQASALRASLQDLHSAVAGTRSRC